MKYSQKTPQYTQEAFSFEVALKWK